MSRLRATDFDSAAVHPVTSPSPRASGVIRVAHDDDPIQSFLFDEDAERDREAALGERVETIALMPASRPPPSPAAPPTSKTIDTVFVPQRKSGSRMTLSDFTGVLLGILLLDALGAVVAGVVVLLLFR